LAEIGYNGFWDCIRASDLGAPHRRDRWFLVGYPNSQHGGSSWPSKAQKGPATKVAAAGEQSAPLADQCVSAGHDTQANTQRSNSNGIRPYRTDLHVNGGAESRDEQVGDVGSVGQDVANSNGERGCSRDTCWEHAENVGEPSGYSWHDAGRMVSWHAEPNVGRVANGVPNRTHRLAALGNAIVPLWAFLVSKVAIAIYDDQDNPRPSIDGLPCATLPGAASAGSGDNCSQPLFEALPR
jgi:DNA (cytosine-5)-methyltransferase 1